MKLSVWSLGLIDAKTRAIFGRSYATEPNQVGVDRNAHHLVFHT
jgi:hypothetical protein